MMEASGLIEVMAMAEGALFRYEKTGDRYELPCWAMGGCSVGGQPMRFQLCIMGGSGGPCSTGAAEEEPVHVDVHLGLLYGGGDAPSWKLWLCEDGRWDSAVYGGRTMSDSEWELDSVIEKAVRRRNAALE